jgi:hypothetical protein
MSALIECPQCHLQFNANQDVLFCPNCGADLHPAVKEGEIQTQQIKITPKAVYAPLWQRFFAYIIDFIIAAVIFYIIDKYITKIDYKAIIESRFPTMSSTRVLIITYLARSMVLSIYFLLYLLFINLITKGQTIGKYCVKIRVVDASSHNPKLKFGWIILQDLIKSQLLILLLDLLFKSFKAGDEKIYRLTQKWAKVHILRINSKNKSK